VVALVELEVEPEVELWAKSGAKSPVGKMMMMGRMAKTIRKKNERKRRNCRLGRSAEAMEPGFSPLRDENHKSFGLFWVGVRCKLLIRLALEPGITGGAPVRPAGDVTLVILFNLHPKFNLRCEASTSLLQKTARGNFCV